MSHHHPTRRSVLKASAVAGAALAAPAASYARIAGTNEELRCAVIGLNGRGRDHIRGLGKHVKAVCDCDRNVLRARAAEASKNGMEFKTYEDFRDLLSSKDIDAVSIATPNHWHSLMGIEAAMAGKHVYVEKPVSHNVWEGRQLANAQKKYDVVIQCGTQSRSSPSLQQAVQFVREGGIGTIQYAIGTCYKPRKSIGKRDQPLGIPGHINYDRWCGPAEKRPLFRERLHYDWHWDFNTGNGDMGNQGIHQMDIARWFLGYDHVSPRILSIGGRLGYDDAGDTPNTQTVIHDYDGAPLIFETRGLPKAKEFQDRRWGREMDNYRGSQIGVIVQGEKGYVVIPSYTSATVFDGDGKKDKDFNGGGNHYQNFIDAAMANDQSKLTGPIIEGHISSALCHTGGVSHVVGKKMTADQIREKVSGESELFQDSVARMLAHLKANEVDLSKPNITFGGDLKMDVAAETVTNHEPANQLMKRTYRDGYEVTPIA